MYRYFALAFVLLLTVNFGESRPASDLVMLDSKKLNAKVHLMESEIQHLKTRLNGAKVHCVDRVTSWQPRSDASIMYLDRQNVQCPPSYFLARFRLGRKGDYNSAEVRYYFKCCSLNI